MAQSPALSRPPSPKNFLLNFGWDWASTDLGAELLPHTPAPHSFPSIPLIPWWPHSLPCSQMPCRAAYWMPLPQS